MKINARIGPGEEWGGGSIHKVLGRSMLVNKLAGWINAR